MRKLSTSMQRDHGNHFYYLIFDGNKPVGDVSRNNGVYNLSVYGLTLKDTYRTFQDALDAANKLYNAEVN